MQSPFMPTPHESDELLFSIETVEGIKYQNKTFTMGQTHHGANPASTRLTGRKSHSMLRSAAAPLREVIDTTPRPPQRY